MAELIYNKAIYAASKKDQSQSPREIMPMGPELKYVGALPTSNNYNFEEEILLGEDKIIEKQNGYHDPEMSLQECYHEVRYYTNNKNNYGYYYLEYFEYDTRANENYDYRVNGNKLIIDLDNSGYESVGGNSLLAKKFKLYYRKANPEMQSEYEDILISTKTLNITTKTKNGIKYCIEQWNWQ